MYFLLYITRRFIISSTAEEAAAKLRKRIDARRIRKATRLATQITQAILEERRKAKLPIMEIERADLTSEAQHLHPKGDITGQHLLGPARTVFDHCAAEGMKPFMKVMYSDRLYMLIAIDYQSPPRRK